MLFTTAEHNNKKLLQKQIGPFFCCEILLVIFFSCFLAKHGFLVISKFHSLVFHDIEQLSVLKTSLQKNMKENSIHFSYCLTSYCVEIEEVLIDRRNLKDKNIKNNVCTALISLIILYRGVFDLIRCRFTRPYICHIWIKF